MLKKVLIASVLPILVTGCLGAAAETTSEDVLPSELPLGSGTYNFGTLANPGACLDVAGAGTGDGVNVQEWWCTGSESQSFRLDDLGGGWAHIVNTKSNKCVDVAWNGTADGTNIAQVTCSGSGAQAWRFEDVGNGAVRIIGQTSNKCIDVAGAGTANGTNVQLWSCNGTNAQAWKPALLSGGGGGPAPVPDPGPGTGTGTGTSGGWNLIWSDEFNGPNGSGVDGSKWTAQTGGSGWGNQELEYYTNSTQNAQQQNGSLVITATPAGANQYGCWYGTCQYTSARLVTQGKFEFTYGRAETRVKIPRGQGLWPAFWMLGNDIGSAGWPTCGEIDIMENIGKEPVTNHGSMHGPGYSGGNPLTGIYNNPSGALGDAFHTYAVEWEPAAVRFYVDGNLYETRTPANLPGGTKWVYDHPFYMLLNLAVGGNWPGSPDGSTSFPQQMLVDYVRVYSASAGVGWTRRTFQGKEDNAASPVEWDYGSYKGDCGGGAAITGMSTNVSGGTPHSLLCSNLGNQLSGNGITTITNVASGEHRRAKRDVYVVGQTDWDSGYYKSECGLNEYVSGVSQTPAGNIHGLRCAAAGMTNNGTAGCETHLVSQEDRGNTGTGDWDGGYYKGECGAGKVVVGVSASTSTGKPHKVLCCSL